MALYFYFNETTGDLVYSDKATYGGSGYRSLGEQINTAPSTPSNWAFDTKRAIVKTVNKDPNLSARINVMKSMRCMFQNCSALITLDLSGLDTSNVTTMNSMFSGCSVLTSIDLSGFDTSNVTEMNDMFANCRVLASLDLSGLDTSNVIFMSDMFRNCRALTSLDLSGFNTSNVVYMLNMFSSCRALTSLDLSSFDTLNVSDMSDMFSDIKDLRIIDISPNMSNALSQLPAATYYDAVTRQSYAKADIPGGSTYVRDLADLDLMATMVQTRMGINVAKRLAHRALDKAGSIDVSGSDVTVVKTEQHQTSYDSDTLEIVCDSGGKVTAMYFVSA